jgi:hypothetical protein
VAEIVAISTIESVSALRSTGFAPVIQRGTPDASIHMVCWRAEVRRQPKDWRRMDYGLEGREIIDVVRWEKER